MPWLSHHSRNTTALRRYARRVWGLRMLAAKYSAKRLTASSPALEMIRGSAGSFLRDKGAPFDAAGTSAPAGPASLPVSSPIVRARAGGRENRHELAAALRPAGLHKSQDVVFIGLGCPMTYGALQD